MTNEQLWTILAAIITVPGLYTVLLLWMMNRIEVNINRRFDDFKQEMNKKFDDFKEKMDNRFSDFKEEMKDRFNDFKSEIKELLKIKA